MKFHVRLVAEAEKDLHDIYSYVVVNDSPGKADALLDNIELTCGTLAYFPQKGHVPPELKRIGVAQYREIHFKPYRVAYEIIGNAVYVHAILDGRRDLQSLFEQRLLR